MAFLSAEYQPCSFCQQKKTTTTTNIASTAVRLHYTKVKSRTNTVYASTLIVLKHTFLVLTTRLSSPEDSKKYNYKMFGDHY